jgi:hypothetical protein
LRSSGSTILPSDSGISHVSLYLPSY